MENEMNIADEAPVSVEALNRYINQTASEDERAHIDRLLKKDEMLKEAMVGLKSIQNPSLLIQMTSDLNTQVASKSGFMLPKATLFHLSSAVIKPLIAVAASLVLVAGGFLVFKNIENRHEQKLAIEKQNNNPVNNNAKDFESSNLYSDSQNLQLIAEKKAESNEEAIMNQTYISRLDSVSFNSSHVLNGSVSSINATGSSTIVASNMMNPMKSLTPSMASAGTYTNSTEDIVKIEESDRKNLNDATVVIKGQVIDMTTKLPINGATIIVDGKPIASSNVNGLYEAKTEPGEHTLSYRQPGYDNVQQQVNLSINEQKNLDIQLNQNLIANNGLVAKYGNNQDKAKDLSTANSPVVINKSSEPVNGGSSTNDLKNGLNSYSSQNYSAAISSLSNALTKDPNNKEALFYIAMSHYNIGNNNKAIAYYNKSISNGGKYKDDALWYKAQILIKQKNNTEAKKILEELKNTKYSQRSSILLENIDKE